RSLGAVREALAAATAEAGDAPTERLAQEADTVEREYAHARAAASALHAAQEELRRAEGERERRITAQREAAVRGAARAGRRERLER
ncbi:hypothetical protein NGM37_07440, partial [Streptomyces sp. TRM76130]|nr:hypothetical protein [Streptomyces sp. TRM76130]